MSHLILEQNGELRELTSLHEIDEFLDFLIEKIQLSRKVMKSMKEGEALLFQGFSLAKFDEKKYRQLMEDMPSDLIKSISKTYH